MWSEERLIDEPRRKKAEGKKELSMCMMEGGAGRVRGTRSDRYRAIMINYPKEERSERADERRRHVRSVICCNYRKRYHIHN